MDTVFEFTHNDIAVVSNMQWLTFAKEDESEKQSIEEIDADKFIKRSGWYTQYGLAKWAEKSVKKKHFSLAALALQGAESSKLGSSWIGVFELPNTDLWWLIAVVGNCVLPHGDKCEEPSSIAAKAKELATTRRWDSIVTSGNVSIDGITATQKLGLDELIPTDKKSIRSTLLVPRNNNQKGKLKPIVLSLVLGACLFANYWIFWGEKNTAPIKTEAVKTSVSENPTSKTLSVFAGAKPEPKVLAVPSATQPLPKVYLSECTKTLFSYSIKRDGWQLPIANCDGNASSSVYQRTEQGIAVHRFKERHADARISANGVSSEFNQALGVMPHRENETLLDISMANLELIGHIQQKRLSVTTELLPVPAGTYRQISEIPETLDTKIVPVIQPWRVMNFKLQTSIPPTSLNEALAIPGLVVRRITMTVNTDNSGTTNRNFSIEGELYGL